MSANHKKTSQETPSAINLNRNREIIFLIRKLMQGGELYNKELNKRYSISAAQLNCLLALYEHGPLPPSQIAKHMMVKSSTVTGVVDRLEQKDLVTRIRNSPDRRVITIQLTDVGKRLAHNAPPPIQRKIIKGLEKLSQKKVDQIVFGLTTLTDMLDILDLDVE